MRGDPGACVRTEGETGERETLAMSPRRQPPIAQTRTTAMAIQSTAVTPAVSQYGRRQYAAERAGYNAVPTGA